MSEISGKVLLGTSGWSYKEWIGPFYTKTDKSMLMAYSKIFETVEIDSTFYRYPSKGMVMGWSRYSPENFVYTAKLPGLITHDKKLDLNQGIEADLEKFIELMEPLSSGGKLGCILIQLPPRFGYRPVQIEGFFKLLPSHVKFAVEFRHPSWMRSETWTLLEKYKVAYTVVDEPLLPPEVHITSDVAYFRWHGRGKGPWYNYRYEPNELQPWVSKIQDTAKKARKVFGYFNNHFHGYAVENCLQLMQMTGTIQSEQEKIKKQIEKYRKETNEQTRSTLEAFAAPRTIDLNSLVAYFVSPERRARAEQIPDGELKIVELTEDRLEATIKEYHLVLDLQRKEISHDCADWEKIMSTRKMCKHIAKFLLSIDRQKALNVLRSIYDKEESWVFRAFQNKK